MNATELKAKIESLREELERTEVAYACAIANEAGLELGKSLVKGNDGAIYRITKVIKHSGDKGFVSLMGAKRLKNGTFAQRESYAGILGFHGCELVTEQNA